MFFSSDIVIFSSDIVIISVIQTLLEMLSTLKLINVNLGAQSAPPEDTKFLPAALCNQTMRACLG